MLDGRGGAAGGGWLRADLGPAQTAALLPSADSGSRQGEDEAGRRCSGPRSPRSGPRTEGGRRAGMVYKPHRTIHNSAGARFGCRPHRCRQSKKQKICNVRSE